MSRSYLNRKEKEQQKEQQLQLALLRNEQALGYATGTPSYGLPGMPHPMMGSMGAPMGVPVQQHTIDWVQRNELTF